jgi:hypothetical protein
MDVTEVEWLSCDEPTKLTTFLRGKTTLRKRRLLGCGMCRVHHAWLLSLHPDKAADAATIERCADGEGSEDEYQQAMRHRYWAWDSSQPGGWAALSAEQQREVYEGQKALDWLNRPWYSAVNADGADAAPTAAMLREIFHPFAHRRPDSACLAWNDGLVPRLAQTIYAERAFEQLPILGDALEDAGYADAAVLAHLRSPGPHVRGCWALDLVLGKE